MQSTLRPVITTEVSIYVPLLIICKSNFHLAKSTQELNHRFYIFRKAYENSCRKKPLLLKRNYINKMLSMFWSMILTFLPTRKTSFQLCHPLLYSSRPIRQNWVLNGMSIISDPSLLNVLLIVKWGMMHLLQTMTMNCNFLLLCVT